MSEVIVRHAQLEDEAHVVELLSLFGELIRPALAQSAPVYREFLQRNRGEILVAVENGTVVGVITFSYAIAMRYAGEYAQIEELMVDNSQRGKGTGALLVNACIEAAKKRGCREIGLYAKEHTRAFYEKLGFVYTGPEVRMPL